MKWEAQKNALQTIHTPLSKYGSSAGVPARVCCCCRGSSISCMVDRHRPWVVEPTRWTFTTFSFCSVDGLLIYFFAASSHPMQREPPHQSGKNLLRTRNIDLVILLLLQLLLSSYPLRKLDRLIIVFYRWFKSKAFCWSWLVPWRACTPDILTNHFKCTIDRHVLVY